MARRNNQMTQMLDDTVADLRRANAELQQKLDERTAERDEALEQQTATAEVLGVINSSPGDLAPVFDAMLEKATRLCEADFGVLYRYDGERFEVVAVRGAPPAFVDFVMREPLMMGPETSLGRLVRGEAVVHFTDSATEEHVRRTGSVTGTLQRLSGARSYLAVPLVKSDIPIGAFSIFRQEVRPFSDKQIALLQNFAAQAVIAMENARLLTETREALDQQTATAEVLGVINSSPGDLAPVFDAMLEKAHRLCSVEFGALQLYEAGKFRAVATRGYPERFVELLRRPYALEPNSPLEALINGGSLVEIADVPEHRAQVPNPRAEAAIAMGIRSVLFLPLRKDNLLLGFISAGRREATRFSEKEISLLQNFAAQAVIAMENARLITETREALEQQTATAEVLGVINSSPGDLAPVFDAILEKAHALCGAAKGALVTFDGERFRAVATRGLSEVYAALLRAPDNPPGSPPQRLLDGESLVQVPDMGALAFPIPRAAAELEGIRTVLYVPLRKDGALLGFITAYRQEVRPFSDKQIALLQNFAAQAVIAMENARLITETREALEQQTATAEVLGVINSSPGDLAPVFEAVLEKAHVLCGATQGALVTFDGELFRARSTRGIPDRFAEHLRRGFAPVSGSATDQLARGDYVHTPDLAAFAAESSPEVARLVQPALELAGTRTILMVPLCKEDQLLGYIAAYRTEVRPFSDKEIALLQNFAAQAVIAMENARLITETREALDQQTATAEVLQVINSSPGDLTPVFDAMLEKAMRLCEGSFGE
jgi:GAF domain-containing protein